MKTTGMVLGENYWNGGVFSSIRSNIKGSASLSVITSRDGEDCANDKEKADALGHYFAAVTSSPPSDKILRIFKSQIILLMLQFHQRMFFLI